jgi:hypothetical protein
MGLQLVCLGEGHCGGRPGQDGFRVCAKAPGNCVAKAHNGAPRLTAEWYIAAGRRAAGCFAAPKLPTTAAGGPLTPRSAGLLTDGEDPFHLTKGQWQLEMRHPGAPSEEVFEMLREMQGLVEQRLAGMDRALQVAHNESAAAHSEFVRQQRTMEELESRAATALQEAMSARQELEGQHRTSQALAQRLRQLELKVNRLRNAGGAAPTTGGEDLEHCKEALFGRTGELQALPDQFVTFRIRRRHRVPRYQVWLEKRAFGLV